MALSGVSSNVLDETAALNFGSITVHERGDANGDNFISSADMFAIRSMAGGPYIVWADCNDDDYVTSADMFCVRNK